METSEDKDPVGDMVEIRIINSFNANYNCEISIEGKKFIVQEEVANLLKGMKRKIIELEAISEREERFDLDYWRRH